MLVRVSVRVHRRLAQLVLSNRSGLAGVAHRHILCSLSLRLGSKIQSELTVSVREPRAVVTAVAADPFSRTERRCTRGAPVDSRRPFSSNGLATEGRLPASWFSIATQTSIAVTFVASSSAPFSRSLPYSAHSSVSRGLSWPWTAFASPSLAAART